MTKNTTPDTGQQVLITGATGMVGSLILHHCLADDRVNKVLSLVRKNTPNPHPKLHEIVVSDFANYDAIEVMFQEVSIIYFCIGVYTGAVDRERFRTITVTYPVKLAEAVHRQSPNAHFCLLSGSGADRTEKSSMAFAKDKGVAENLLSALDFNQFYSFRPGYIYPVKERKEPNFSYRLMRYLYPLLKILGPNFSITSEELAKAMFETGFKSLPTEVFENAEILAVLEA